MSSAREQVCEDILTLRSEIRIEEGKEHPDRKALLYLRQRLAELESYLYHREPLR